MATQDQRQKARSRRSSGAQSNNSLDASGISMAFIENLNQFADSSRRVNSSVRHASRKQEGQVLGDETQKTDAALNGKVEGRSNNSLDASGISLPFIANLDATADSSRRVNSGVRHASHKQRS
jgi:hypothetical protein